MNSKLRAIFLIGVIACCGATACTRHTIDVQPIRIEPIYMTIDVNVRVDRELDNFFDYKDQPRLPESIELPHEMPEPPATEGDPTP